VQFFILIVGCTSYDDVVFFSVDAGEMEKNITCLDAS
jgi:hypothetical protein